MIPRSISQIFKAMTKRSDFTHTLHISYMEIYNSSAYDLLDPSRDIKEMADLPAVSIQEDASGRFHMRNLSLHRCVNSQKAMWPAHTCHKQQLLTCNNSRRQCVAAPWCASFSDTMIKLNMVTPNLTFSIVILWQRHNKASASMPRQRLSS